VPLEVLNAVAATIHRLHDGYNLKAPTSTEVEVEIDVPGELVYIRYVDGAMDKRHNSVCDPPTPYCSNTVTVTATSSVPVNDPLSVLMHAHKSLTRLRAACDAAGLRAVVNVQIV
jgi:hypothetical protein